MLLLAKLHGASCPGVSCQGRSKPAKSHSSWHHTVALRKKIKNPKKIQLGMPYYQHAISC